MKPYWFAQPRHCVTKENSLIQGFALWLTRRRVPTGSNKHLLSSWHRLKITLYLLLTINCRYSMQLGLTFLLTKSHQNGLSEGVAKSKSYRFIIISQHTCESFVIWHTWWETQTSSRAFWYSQGTRSTEKVSDLPPTWQEWRSHHENHTEHQSSW